VLKLHVDKAPAHEPRPGLIGDAPLTGKQIADQLNAAVRSELQCDGPAEKLGALISKLGVKGIKLFDFEPCYPTRCDPAPPLDQGCTAGPCTKGGYDVVCGARKCKMTGLPAEQSPSLDVVYACTESGISMRTRGSAPLATPSLKGKTVVLVSPSAELREAVTAAVTKAGGKVVDGTPLFVELFGEHVSGQGGAGGARGKVGPGDFSVKLAEGLPAEAVADFGHGLAACKKKWNKKPGANEPCAEQLVQAVWQRHLVRTAADLVLVLRSLPGTKGTQAGAEKAVYAPSSTSIDSSVISSGDFESLAALIVTQGLDVSSANGKRKVHSKLPGGR
jgi:hypothetical protein